MDKLTPHTPHAHYEHKAICGCATNEKEAYMVCNLCGATYTSEVLSFNYWRCYDCGGVAYMRRMPAMKRKPEGFKLGASGQTREET